MRPTSARLSIFTKSQVRRLAAVSLAVALGAAAVARSDDTGQARASVASLAQQVALTEQRAALAASDDFYVVVDPVRNKLVLMLKGATLREYPIEALQVGAPRVAFRQRHLADDWQGRIWKGGALVPARDHERIEIIPPDSTKVDSTNAAVLEPPPLPEDMYPVPPRYHVRYTGGLSLEFRPHELDESQKWTARISNGLHGWYRDMRAALAEQPEDVVRLRILMQPEHAASFYRALPPSTLLLVLPRS